MKRTFIVGCPRSGTTLIQSVLSAYGGFVSFPETHIFSKIFSGRKNRYLPPPLKYGYLSLFFLSWKKKHGYSLPLSISLTRDLLCEDVLSFFDSIAVKENKIGWIEKTPSHLHVLEEIRKLSPSAYVIQILRDGRANIASMYEYGSRLNKHLRNKFRDLDYCIYRYNKCLCDLRTSSEADNMILLSYDKFIDDPIGTTRRVFEKIEVRDANPADIIANFNKVENLQLIIDKKEKWKSTNNRDIFNQGLKKYNSIFSEKEKEKIEQNINWHRYRKLDEDSL